MLPAKMAATRGGMSPANASLDLDIKDKKMYDCRRSGPPQCDCGGKGGVPPEKGKVGKVTHNYVQYIMDGSVNGTVGTWELGIENTIRGPYVTHWIFNPR